MKKLLRERILKERDALMINQVVAKSNRICKAVEDWIITDSCKTVFIYIPTNNEVNVYPLINKLLSLGKTVTVPLCVDKGIMIASKIEDLETDLVPGLYGILAPKKQNLVAVQNIDTVIVPGVGFDKCGNRLGFGGGYYDRFLPQTRVDTKKIAVCYDLQFVDDLVVESWDVPMDIVITESKTYIMEKPQFFAKV
ncbi:MAG: 5-formyltetrahydrofolate cyclo-ligase [Clostridiales bacterium]